MEKQTKLLLGLAGAGVLGYLIWKNSKKTTTSTSTTTSTATDDECSTYAGNKLAATRFASEEAYNSAWNMYYNECKQGKSGIPKELLQAHQI